jgi:hypothetical protein
MTSTGKTIPMGIQILLKESSQNKKGHPNG